MAPTPNSTPPLKPPCPRNNNLSLPMVLPPPKVKPLTRTESVAKDPSHVGAKQNHSGEGKQAELMPILQKKQSVSNKTVVAATQSTNTTVVASLKNTAVGTPNKSDTMNKNVAVGTHNKLAPNNKTIPIVSTPTKNVTSATPKMLLSAGAPNNSAAVSTTNKHIAVGTPNKVAVAPKSSKSPVVATASKVATPNKIGAVLPISSDQAKQSASSQELKGSTKVALEGSKPMGIAPLKSSLGSKPSAVRRPSTAGSKQVVPGRADSLAKAGNNIGKRTGLATGPVRMTERSAAFRRNGIPIKKKWGSCCVRAKAEGAECKGIYRKIVNGVKQDFAKLKLPCGVMIERNMAGKNALGRTAGLLRRIVKIGAAGLPGKAHVPPGNIVGTNGKAVLSPAKATAATRQPVVVVRKPFVPSKGVDQRKGAGSIAAAIVPRKGVQTFTNSAAASVAKSLNAQGASLVKQIPSRAQGTAGGRSPVNKLISTVAAVAKSAQGVGKSTNATQTSVTSKPSAVTSKCIAAPGSRVVTSPQAQPNETMSSSTASTTSDPVAQVQIPMSKRAVPKPSASKGPHGVAFVKTAAGAFMKPPPAAAVTVSPAIGNILAQKRSAEVPQAALEAAARAAAAVAPTPIFPTGASPAAYGPRVVTQVRAVKSRDVGVALKPKPIAYPIKPIAIANKDALVANDARVISPAKAPVKPPVKPPPENLDRNRIPEGLSFKDGDHITIWNCTEKRKIAGNAAPLGKNLAKYLDRHPDCQVFVDQDKKLPKKKWKGRKTQQIDVKDMQAGDHVSIWNRKEQRKIAGNAAPLVKNLPDYLRKRPYCEVYTNQAEVLRGMASKRSKQTPKIDNAVTVADNKVEVKDKVGEPDVPKTQEEQVEQKTAVSTDPEVFVMNGTQEGGDVAGVTDADMPDGVESVEELEPDLGLDGWPSREILDDQIRVYPPLSPGSILELEELGQPAPAVDIDEYLVSGEPNDEISPLLMMGPTSVMGNAELDLSEFIHIDPETSNAYADPGLGSLEPFDKTFPPLGPNFGLENFD